MKNIPKIKEIYICICVSYIEFFKKLIKNKELYNKEIIKSNY